MACGTTDEALYVVLLNELFAQTDLVRRSDVRHIENFVAGPKVALRVTMTIETPFHRQRLTLPCKWHFVDAPVTGGATDAFADVNTVIEIDILRKVIYSRPRD